MRESVYLFLKRAVKNVGYVLASSCGRHKNNFQLQFRTSCNQLIQIKEDTVL